MKQPISTRCRRCGLHNDNLGVSEVCQECWVQLGQMSLEFEDNDDEMLLTDPDDEPVDVEVEGHL